MLTVYLSVNKTNKRRTNDNSRAQCFKDFKVNPLSPHDALKCHLPEKRPNFPTTMGFRMKISMKLVYQYMTIFFNFLPTSNHVHPLQAENCDSNSRLVVDEDDNGKFRLERVQLML